MSDPMTRAGRRAETLAETLGTSQPRETPTDRLWTAVWSLVGILLLNLVALTTLYISVRSHDGDASSPQDRLDLLVVSCAAVVDMEPPPDPCRRPDVLDAFDAPPPR